MIENKFTTKPKEDANNPLLRQATAEDESRIFNWRNDSWLASFSSGNRIVTWEEHRRWFERVSDDTRHLVFIIEINTGYPIGSIRFDREGSDAATVSVFIERAYTAKGIGSHALVKGCAAAFEAWSINVIKAGIKPDNYASIKAFRKAGFVEDFQKASPPNFLRYYSCRRDQGWQNSGVR